MPPNIAQLFLNWYALTDELCHHRRFNENEFSADIVGAICNAFDVVDGYQLRPMLPDLNKQGRALLEHIETTEETP